MGVWLAADDGDDGVLRDIGVLRRRSVFDRRRSDGEGPNALRLRRTVARTSLPAQRHLLRTKRTFPLPVLALLHILIRRLYLGRSIGETFFAY